MRKHFKLSGKGEFPSIPARRNESKFVTSQRPSGRKKRQKCRSFPRKLAIGTTDCAARENRHNRSRQQLLRRPLTQQVRLWFRSAIRSRTQRSSACRSASRMTTLTTSKPPLKFWIRRKISPWIIMEKRCKLLSLSNRKKLANSMLIWSSLSLGLQGRHWETKTCQELGGFTR